MHAYIHTYMHTNIHTCTYPISSPTIRHTCSVHVWSNNADYNILLIYFMSLPYFILFKRIDMSIRLCVRSQENVLIRNFGHNPCVTCMSYR